MLPDCPITMFPIEEPIRITSMKGTVVRLFEAEAILQWLENTKLTDPCNNQSVERIDVASEIRTAEEKGTGEQYQARVDALNTRITQQLPSSASAVTANPALRVSGIVQFSSGVINRGQEWHQQEVPLPRMITLMNRATPATNNKINVLFIGDATRFQFRELMDQSERMVGIDFFTRSSERNKFNIWDLSGLERFTTLVSVHLKKTDILLFFGNDLAHYQRFLAQYEGGDRVVQTLSIQANNHQMTAQPVDLEAAPLQAVSVRGDGYAACALTLLDQAVLQRSLINQQATAAEQNSARPKCSIL